jgi:hypothetical protein
MEEGSGVRRFRVALNRLLISALLVVALTGLAVACDSDSGGSTCGAGTHDENGVCVVDDDDDGAQGNTETNGAGNDDGSGTNTGSETGTGTAGCNKVFEDDHYIDNTADIDALAGTCEVTGDLVVYTSSLTSLSLPQITEIGGALSVLHNDTLTSFELPNLKSVGDYVTVENNLALTSFDLPALTDVGEGEFDNVSVKYNDVLVSFDLSSLTRVTGSVFARFNTVLTSFDLSALSRVGGFLDMTDNDVLAQCLIDALVEQVEAAEGIEDSGSIGGPNNLDCTCTEVGGVLEADCD